MNDERQQLINHILRIDRHLDRRLQAGGGLVWADVDLTMPQLKVLLLVVRGEGITMTQLARSLGMTLSTATGVVDRLVDHGLVRREDHPHDRRLVLLQPTEAGNALVDRLMQAKLARLHLILDRLSLDDLRTVARAVDVLHEAAMSVFEIESTASTGSRAHD